MSTLFGLFVAAFAAATIFPAQSEALLTALIVQEEISPWLLIVVASAGNILGSCVNWMLGRYIETLKTRRWFPVGDQALTRAQDAYQKYGRWSLLLSWMPILGDPITVVAGILKEKFWVFLLLVSIAKTGRYILLALLTLSFLRNAA